MPGSNDKALEARLPSATVVVLNYNGVEHLETCFRSLQRLVYPTERLELMLVDNGSTDGSVEFVRRHFPQVTVVCNDDNYGFSKGNNIGAEKARGEVVAFLNNDMRVDVHWLLELVRPLLDDPHIVATGSKILTRDGKKIDFVGSGMNFYGFGYQLGWGREDVESYTQVEPVLFPCGGAMLVRRSEFLVAGGFDEDFFAYYEDLDLGWRLWVLGYKIVVAPRSIAYHVHHGYWGQVASEKKRVLYERNAMLATIKNYEDAHLQRVLPVALLLLAERAYLSAGIDDATFRAGPAPEKPRLPSPAPAEPEPDGIRPPAVHYDAHYYAGEAWRTLRQGGAGALYHRIRAELKRRMGNRSPRQMLFPTRARHVSDTEVIVPRQALSYLVAADDVIALYGKMLEKRRFIQTNRRRSDEELFKLFALPLEVSYFTAEYGAAQHHLVRLFGIDGMFGQGT